MIYLDFYRDDYVMSLWLLLKATAKPALEGAGKKAASVQPPGPAALGVCFVPRSNFSKNGYSHPTSILTTPL